ncbi:hypothetical protein [Streptomyces sp. SGAir0924]|uniref:hypothetical protein n=1 Tax=Streptomyces sp. SGAir0924 TaxID=2109593 RepID=UPI0010CCB384|nr:hypothetical protein [Streptomyces sp. SGAir0924]QCR49792.1 hypothetical protein C1N79_26040 [Streptomyces sp. SGAir0924]
MTPTSHPADVLALLADALPELDTLTDDQVRGAHCAWCKAPVIAEDAVDFGEKTSPASWSTSTIGVRWYPRACPACAADRAHRALLDHASDCADCRRVPAPGEPTVCEVARVLTRLVREGRTAWRSNRMRPTEGTPTR